MAGFILKADTTNYYGKMNYVFQHVNKSLITIGLLRDYGIEFLNLDNYTGAALHDSNFVALDERRDECDGVGNDDDIIRSLLKSCNGVVK